MKRVTLYSSSRSSMTERATPTNHPNPLTSPDQARENSSAHVASQQLRSRWRNLWVRYERPLWVGAAGLVALLVVFTHALIRPSSRETTPDDISAAVLPTLDAHALRAPA